jgi:hypothetical protein
VFVLREKSGGAAVYDMSAKKAEVAALAWPCSPLRPPVPFFGFAWCDAEVATLLLSSPASSPSFCARACDVAEAARARCGAAPHQQLAALPELHGLVVADAGDERAVKRPAAHASVRQAAAAGGRRFAGAGGAHAQALHRKIAVLAEDADEGVGVQVDEADEAVAAARARHVGVDGDERVDAFGVAGEPDGREYGVMEGGGGGGAGHTPVGAVAPVAPREDGDDAVLQPRRHLASALAQSERQHTEYRL